MPIALRTTALCAALLAVLGTQSAVADWLSDESGLPSCRRTGEGRVPIAVWSDEDTPPPPMPGGTVVYLSLRIDLAFGDDPDSPCETSGGERAFTLKFPNDAKRPEAGGVRVHLRGDAEFNKGACALSSFYITAPASNIREGWTDMWLRDTEGSIAV